MEIGGGIWSGVGKGRAGIWHFGVLGYSDYGKYIKKGLSFPSVEEVERIILSKILRDV